MIIPAMVSYEGFDYFKHKGYAVPNWAANRTSIPFDNAMPAAFSVSPPTDTPRRMPLTERGSQH